MAVVRQRRLPHLTLDLSSSSLSSASTAGDRRLRFSLPPPAPVPSASTSDHHRLSDYEKLCVLGHGNGGTVYKVRHRRSASLFALKLLPSGDGATASSSARETEILLRASGSPHVLRCHASFATPSGDSALLLELMDGGSLDSLLRHRGRRPFPELALAAVARHALLGLSHLHSLKIVHRDLKPSNLLINSSGEIKIADFGVGKILRRSLDPCMSYVGTAAYMSPERFDPETYGGDYDPYAADVWSLGIAILELKLGYFPLLQEGQRPDWAALMCAICFGEPPRLPETADASPELRGFVELCLQKDSGKRATVTELLNHPFVLERDLEEEKKSLLDLMAEAAAAPPPAEE